MLRQARATGPGGFMEWQAVVIPTKRVTQHGRTVLAPKRSAAPFRRDPYSARSQLATRWLVVVAVAD